MKIWIEATVLLVKFWSEATMLLAKMGYSKISHRGAPLQE